MALTPKQRRFVDEYLVDLNATQAAIRAGYSEKTARQIADQNLSKLYIKSAIESRMKDREQRIEITQDKVLKDLEAIKQHAMQISHDAQGNAYMNNYASAIKATELQGKHLGMFKEKVELTGANGGPIETSNTFDTSKLSTAALKEIIEASKGEANKS
jgi:phage terminase small subunit